MLDDVERLEALMQRAADAAQVGVVQAVSHRFSPQGVTVVLVLEESHMSIHTWPEADYAAVDFYTCGEADPRVAHRVLEAGLDSPNSEIALFHRGMRTSQRSMERVPTGDLDENHQVSKSKTDAFS